MMRISATRAIGVLASFALWGAAVPSLASAQGNLSTQGFGYPLGGLSTRAAGSAGALGDFDALSPRNPASLVGLTRAVITAQAEPEFRTLHFSTGDEHTNVQRMPLIMLGLRVSSKAVLSLSGAAFLDRSYSTLSTGQAAVEGQTVPTQDQTVVKGAISDLRAALGWQLTPRLSVGLGVHVFTGSNNLELSRRFADTLAFGTVLDTSTVNYFGKAVSLGAQYQFTHGIAASASYRAGAGIEAGRRDTIFTKATVPNRLAGSLLYTGITGSSFAFSVENINWSALQKLGSDDVVAHDATNWSLGAEIQSGKLRGSPVLTRIGTAHNTLPFGIGSQVVHEQRYGVGLGVPLTRQESATFDFSLQRASRTLEGSSVHEGAWLFGIGLQIRP